MAEEKKQKTKRPTAQKRDIRNSKRRDINRAFKSEVRTAVRTLESNLGKGDKTVAMGSLNDVYGSMDKGVKRGIFKQNKANRTKARYALRLQRTFPS